MTRGVNRYNRLYLAGRDVSCSTLSVAEVGLSFDAEAMASWCESVKGALPGAPVLTVGQLSGYLDTERLHALRDTSSTVLTLAFGGTAVPAAGAPVFSAPVIVRSYQAGEGETISTVTMTFDVLADSLTIPNPFGTLLHTMSAEAAANTGGGVDGGAASTCGAWMAYHIQSVTGTGSVTVSVEDSADGTAFAAVSGLSSGAIADSAVPVSGLAQTAASATIRRYTRWQLSLTGVTSVTFALALMRGI